MKKKFIRIFVTIILIATSVVLIYFWKSESSEVKTLRFECCPFQEIKISNDSLILKIPVIEYKKPGNEYSKAEIVDYTNTIIQKGSEFTIDPLTLGQTIGGGVAEIKLKLIEINANSIVVDILADRMWDKKFYPRKTIEREEIKNKRCIGARPLVMDVHYEYCFNLEDENDQMVLKYRVTEESTMPGP